AANVTISKDHANLRKTLKPYVEITRGGLKIAILGITTDELVYRWRIKGGGVDLPATTAWKYLPTLRARNDLVIVLSHLGTPADLDLVSKTSGIDLIVGGHSHTRLESPVNAKDLLKRSVPVVQAGEHGNFIGRMLVKVSDDKKMQILKYQLVPVKSEAGQSSDADEIRRLVTEARSLLEQKYSSSWLYETVGFTNIPMVRPKESATVWGGFFMETIRRSASADISLDVGEFHGVSQPAGLITQESLMKSYPRVFDIKQTMGWNIWKIKVPGWMLQLMLDQVVKQGLYMNTAGLTYEVNSAVTGASTRNMKIQGKKIDWFKQYNIAVTEGVGRGTLEISWLLQKMFAPRDTGVPVWTALEKRLRENGGTFAGSAAASPVGMIR
ncbi:MAG: 5'-nucleotidase C-terminal domain-containing protein, partial [Bdellovibrionales bacterium]|nr:5'-nucleotidase C-terminal domain-containing protein [Bdellovibrionales bacterium]